MSQEKSKIKAKNVTLFFNRHLNMFPDDFFVTKNKKFIILKNSIQEESAKNEQNNEEYCSGRNNTTSNFRKSIKKLSNIIRFDNICYKNKNFSFKQRDGRSKYNKKYYMNIYNNNKFNGVNIQSNELFKESSKKTNKNYTINKNNYNYINNSKINLLKKQYIQTEISKESISSNNSKPTTPLFVQNNIKKNIQKRVHKIIKINISNDNGIKYPKIKQHIKSKQYKITASEKNMKNFNDINKLNKRPSSTNKQKIKTKIKNTIDNIFVELSKNNEENQDILDKFNNLIKDVKNIQKVIKHKKSSIFKNNTMKNN